MPWPLKSEHVNFILRLSNRGMSWEKCPLTIPSETVCCLLPVACLLLTPSLSSLFRSALSLTQRSQYYQKRIYDLVLLAWSWSWSWSTFLQTKEDKINDHDTGDKSQHEKNYNNKWNVCFLSLCFCFCLHLGTPQPRKSAGQKWWTPRWRQILAYSGLLLRLAWFYCAQERFAEEYVSKSGSLCVWKFTLISLSSLPP